MQKYKYLDDTEKFKLWKRVIPCHKLIEYVEQIIVEEQGDLDDLFFFLEELYGLEYLLDGDKKYELA